MTDSVEIGGFSNLTSWIKVSPSNCDNDGQPEIARLAPDAAILHCQLSVVVAITWQHFFRAYHGQKSQISAGPSGGAYSAPQTLLCGLPIGGITRLAVRLSICPVGARNSKTKKRRKIKFGTDVPHGTSKCSANFRYERSRSQYVKPPKSGVKRGSHRLHTRPTPLLGLLYWLRSFHAVWVFNVTPLFIAFYLPSLRIKLTIRLLQATADLEHWFLPRVARSASAVLLS